MERLGLQLTQTINRDIPVRIQKRTIEAPPSMRIIIQASAHPAKLKRGAADSKKGPASATISLPCYDFCLIDTLNY